MRPRPDAQARLRLFCFPFAGAGASALHAWARTLPAGIEPLVAQLPGRENRLREVPFQHMTPLVQALVEHTQPWLDRPFALFGYSLGSIVAFELARTLRGAGLPEPARRFVAARRAPHLPETSPHFSHLPDTQFAAALQQRYSGIPKTIWENAELLDLFLPTLRADMVLGEGYQYVPGQPLACAISVFGGQADAHVTPVELAAWQEHTRGAMSLRLMPGDHFFLQNTHEAFSRAVADDLAGHLAGT